MKAHCVPRLLFSTIVVDKAGEQSFREEFSTHLSVEHYARGSPDVFTSLYFADKPRTQLAYFLPLTDATCVHQHL
jgi:hypothetical protein